MPLCGAAKPKSLCRRSTAAQQKIRLPLRRGMRAATITPCSAASFRRGAFSIKCGLLCGAEDDGKARVRDVEFVLSIQDVMPQPRLQIDRLYPKDEHFNMICRRGMRPIWLLPPETNRIPDQSQFFRGKSILSGMTSLQAKLRFQIRSIPLIRLVSTKPGFESCAPEIDSMRETFCGEGVTAFWKRETKP